MIIAQEDDPKPVLASSSNPSGSPRLRKNIVSSPVIVNSAIVDDSAPPPPYSSIRDAPLPPLPVAPADEPVQQMPVPEVETAPFTRFSPFQPLAEQHVNHICLFSKHNSISGTYHVDPVVPEVTPGLQKTNRLQRDALRSHRKNSKRAFGSSDATAGEPSISSCGKRNPQQMNASFRTRHGSVTLDIAVVGTASGALVPVHKADKVQARVMASSRHGRLNLNLFEIHPDRCVDLDISTRDGAITVFFPLAFSGPIAFRTRRGREGIMFLPELAKRASIVRATDHEVLVVLSSPDAQDAPAATSHVQFKTTPGDDCAMIGSRHGKITVGISGMDRLDNTVAPPGILQKIGGLIETSVTAFVQSHAKAIEAKLVGGGLQSRRSIVRGGLVGAQARAYLSDRPLL
ncbi:hypothetical protein OBBRIDRAFT_784171 [Obba rivulosa]|uniref:DUF7330 domain-containing protein n=1 Tax=Obba rivulosa TaxID=1052685 RepID=A0A8E2AQ22_9APHY|nr:hypothetical protein OBBRIDRAFT_784171 [Obba rivulosa]